MNNVSNEIIKKDALFILKNKKIIGIMCLVPVVLTIIMPTVFVVSIKNISVNLDMFSKILNIEMDSLTSVEQRKIVVDFFLYNVLPIFFMLIPTMMSTIISANSFVGEREKGTLETLFLSPIKVSDIFIAKVKVSLFLSMSINIIVFIFMFIILNIVLYVTNFNFLIPDLKWFCILAITSLAITILSTTFIIKKSQNSDSVEEAQQSAVFIILPIIAIVIGQFTGVIIINRSAIILVSVVLLVVSIAVMKLISKKSDYYM
ncbi:ABC-2 transporter permease [Peptostreptococcus stomatis]|uniref:ABC transporter permease subunit n=1 Tax=Peptostreptococcus stomatis TaxID=341694 RepID=UPI0002F78E7B|nr:ABC transporter permease subunit [Peptostreptococcus stomatis]